MRRTALPFALVVAVLLLCAACSPSGDAGPDTAADDAASAPARPSVDPEAIRRAVADPMRTPDARARDRKRKPAEVLEFFEIAPGMRVLDLMGTGGYYTEIVSDVVGPEGTVYVHNTPYVLERFAAEPLEALLDRLDQVKRTNVERIDADLDEMEPPADLDAALFIRFYHDLFWLPTADGDLTDRAEFLRRVYDALKPGGVFGVIDHRAPEGSGSRYASEGDENLHRIDEALVRAEIEAAGFVLDASSDVLANPEDTRDWQIFVDEGKRRDTTDRFVLRFVKPAP